MKKIVILLIAAVVVIVGILGVLQLFKPGGDDTAKQFVNSFVAGDSETTYSMLSAAAKVTDSPETWKLKVDGIKGFFSGEPTLTSSPKNDVSAKAHRSEYVFSAKGKDGEYKFLVVVEREKGKPKILSFQSTLVKPGAK